MMRRGGQGEAVVVSTVVALLPVVVVTYSRLPLHDPGDLDARPVTPSLWRFSSSPTSGDSRRA
jgi:hypothetical protein